MISGCKNVHLITIIKELASRMILGSILVILKESYPFSEKTSPFLKKITFLK